MTAARPEKTKRKLKPISFYKNKLSLPLILLSLAGYVVTQITPILIKGSAKERPELWQISLTGIIVILLSVCFLAYAAKVIGLSRGWLVLAVAFSSLIVIAKFILVPESLYSQTYRIGNGLLAWNPNQTGSYIGIAAILFAVYAATLYFAYRHYHGTLPVSLRKNKLAKKSAARAKPGATVAFVILALIVLAVMSGGVLLMLPLIFLGPTFEYVNFAFNGGGFGLLLATVLAITLSIKYMQHSANAAIKAKDGTILAVALWIGVSLLLMYHILWVVYITVMLTLWPFKTISPSGK
jgi:hypothetical protein